MATLIRENGIETSVTPRGGSRSFGLKEMQRYVNGYIEIIPLKDNKSMVINEDGKYSCDYNEKATKIARESNAIYPKDFICGTVLICNSKEIE